MRSIIKIIVTITMILSGMYSGAKEIMTLVNPTWTQSLPTFLITYYPFILALVVTTTLARLYLALEDGSVIVSEKDRDVINLNIDELCKELEIFTGHKFRAVVLTPVLGQVLWPRFFSSNTKPIDKKIKYFRWEKLPACQAWEKGDPLAFNSGYLSVNSITSQFCDITELKPNSIKKLNCYGTHIALPEFKENNPVLICVVLLVTDPKVFIAEKFSSTGAFVPLHIQRLFDLVKGTTGKILTRKG